MLPLDLLAILSFIIGYNNLIENREQSEYNDINSANDKQAKYLLNEMPPMSPGRIKKMNLQAFKTPALTADDKLEKVVQCNMSFTGS